MSSPGGADLKTVLAQGGPLEPARAVKLITQIAAAVDYAYAHQTVHREISSASIRLSDDNDAYLADSGTDTSPSGVVTGDEISYRADIYALTGVLYECLTGMSPTADSPVPPNSSRSAGVPTAFDEVIARGMARDPAERFSSADELVGAARRALTSVPRAAPSGQLTRQIATSGQTWEVPTFRLPPSSPVPSSATVRPRRRGGSRRPTGACRARG